MRTQADRIVTLLPSATEIVCALGLRDKIVGVTHECDCPTGIEKLPHVTRSAIDSDASGADIDAAVRRHLANHNALYTLDEPLLRKLAPDLIVTQALCEVCAVSESEVVAALDRLPGKPRLVNLEPMNLTDVLDTVTLVGEAAGCPQRGARLRLALEKRIAHVRTLTGQLAEADKPTVGFLEWTTPLFNAGHWTPEIIEYAGGVDSFGLKQQPSRSIPDDTLVSADPDVLIVAPCGFDQARAHRELEELKSRIDFKRLTAYRNGRVHALDGNAYFNRPGPRLVDSLELLTDLLHPGLRLTT